MNQKKILFILFIVLCIFWLKDLEFFLDRFRAPFIWIFSTGGALCLLGVFACQKPVLRMICIHTGAAFLALLLFEAYLWNQAPDDDLASISYEGDYFQRNEILGYGPKKGSQVRSLKLYGKEFVYYVSYTIDSNGLRISPAHNPNASGCILFFGGSFTFGEGVQDEQTLPYQLGLKTGGKFLMYNFGFHGYGPHQMLSAIEQGLVERVIQCDPKHVFYWLNTGHIARSAGLAPWDSHGPRYILDENGLLKFSGRFDEHFLIPIDIRRQLKSSLIYRKTIGIDRSLRDGDFQLFWAIIEKAKQLAHRRFPNSEFHVLFWDLKDTTRKQKEVVEHLTSHLVGKEFDLNAVSVMLPKFHEDPSAYELSPYDRHPNPLAYEMIAEYLVQNIIGAELEKEY